MSVTLITKKIDTAPLQIKVAIPPENPQIKGYFTGRARIRTKPENKALFERIENGELEGDEELLRQLYDGFDGLGNDSGAVQGEDAWKEILTGHLSAYLVPAAVQAYYEQYGEARQGNSKRSRGR